MSLPPFLTQTVILGNELWRWLAALGLALLALLILQAVRNSLRTRLASRAEPRAFRFDDLLFTLLGATRNWALLAAAIFVAVLLLALDPVTSLRLRQVLGVFLLIQLAIWGNAAIVYFAEVYRRNETLDGGRRTSLAALTFVGRLVLFSLLLLMLLDNLGLDVTTLIAGLGVGSIAVALAVQGILSDLFASLSIVFDKPFEIGDFIIVDDMQGNVEHIGLRTTRIRSLSGEQLVFANKDLLDSRIRNYKRMAERRIVFALGVEFGTPRELLERIPLLLRGLIEEFPDTRFDRSHFRGFGEYSLDFETVYYVLTADYNRYMDIQQSLNLQIYDRFSQLGIDFALPVERLEMRTARSGGRDRLREAATSGDS
ncbi:MAG TPA: mechanosensitive ion channel family protein [Trueperaceae bacterium]